MRVAGWIALREWKRYLATPVAYLVFFLFLLVLGWIFNQAVSTSLFTGFPPGPDTVIRPMLTLLVFSIPALTMRLLSEENRLGTLEILLTAPVREWEVVLGKWLGVMGVLTLLLAVTLIYPLLLDRLVVPGIDWGQTWAGYLGLWLVCAALSALGVAVSGLFRNQIAAFVVTLTVFLAFWMVGMFGSQGQSLWATVVQHLDFSRHFSLGFAQGVVDVKSLVYLLSVTAFGLFLGTFTLESRKWRV